MISIHNFIVKFGYKQQNHETVGKSQDYCKYFNFTVVPFESTLAPDCQQPVPNLVKQFTASLFSCASFYEGEAIWKKIYK